MTAQENRTFSTLDRALAQLDETPTCIALVVGRGQMALALRLAHTFPASGIDAFLVADGSENTVADLPGNLTVHDFRSGPTVLDVMRNGPRPELIVELSPLSRERKADLLRQLIFLAPAGGHYIIDTSGSGDEDPGQDQDEVRELLVRVARIQKLPKDAQDQDPRLKYDVELARSTGQITLGNDLLVVEKSREHLWKVREWDFDALLAARSAPCETIETRPAYTYDTRAAVEHHGDGPDSKASQEINVMQQSVRRYRDVSWHARQIFTKDDVFLPDTFRHPHRRTLVHRGLTPGSRHLARLKVEPTSQRDLKGEFYNFDTEYPGHFGHVTTEVLSRFWGWRIAREQNPSIRPLASVYKEGKGIHRFQRELFATLGVPESEWAVAHVGEHVNIESLVSATPQFENPHYADLELADVWEELGERLPPGRSGRRPDKIFISRRDNRKRYCVNTPAIERFFAWHGFTILYPEDLRYAEQKHYFADARIIAGFGGSGMFNMMFAPQARIVLICADDYVAQNEYLFAAVNGNELHYFWGPSIPDPVKEGAVKAIFAANFSFDLKRHKRELRRVIK